MIEVITEGRVVKFDKEKKIIAFLNIKKMKERARMTDPYNRVFGINVHEIPLREPEPCFLDYPIKIGYDTSKMKPEILQQRVDEMKKWMKELIVRTRNA